MGGIKLQLLCGIRIELAVGSLPYLVALARYPSRSLPIPCSAWRRGVTNTPTPWAWGWTPQGAYPQLDLGSGAHSNKQTMESYGCLKICITMILLFFHNIKFSSLFKKDFCLSLLNLPILTMIISKQAVEVQYPRNWVGKTLFLICTLQSTLNKFPHPLVVIEMHRISLFL